MDCSPMADMFALVSTSSPESFSFNWAVTVRTRDLGSSDVMFHWSAVASIDSHGVWSGAGTLGGEFSSHPAEILTGVALVDSHFTWRLGFVFFLGFIFFLSLWTFTRAQSTAGHP